MKRGRAATGSTPQRSGSSFVDCPLCAKSFHSALIAAHVDGCLGVVAAEEPPKEEEATTLGGKPKDEQTKAPADPSPPPPADAPAPAPSAFAAMMRAQRGASCKRVFTAWIDAATDAWRWVVEPGAAPGAAAEAAGFDASGARGGGGLFTAVVKFKEKTTEGEPCETTLTLVTDVQPASAGEAEAELRAAARPPSDGSRGPSDGAPHLSPGVLKSALQKNIRRGRIVSAARCARLLLLQSPSEALRRLPVIALEDAVAHPATPLVAWLAAAHSKGYALPRSARDVVVRYAAELAACDGKDVDVVGEDAFDEKENGAAAAATATTTTSELCNLAVACRGLDASRQSGMIVALCVRAHFGGMKGDVDMLRASAATWRARFVEENAEAKESNGSRAGAGPSWSSALDALFASAAEKASAALALAARRASSDDAAAAAVPALASAAPVDAGALTRKDVPPAAIDFHVSDVVEDACRSPRASVALTEALDHGLDRALGEDLPALVRSVIWSRCSSVTDKSAWSRAWAGAGAEVRLLPIRPRSRGARRSLRTFPVVTLHPRFPFNV